MPSDITDNSEFQKPVYSFLPTEEEAEKQPTKSSRDSIYSFLARNALDRYDFANAKKLAEKIDQCRDSCQSKSNNRRGVADTAIQRTI